MNSYPWKSRALCMFAPHSDEVEQFCTFVEKVLVPDKIDTVVMIIRYDFMFMSHPECRGDYPLSLSDVKKMVDVCIFLDYAKEHDNGHILGIMETTWVPAKYLMNAFLGLPSEYTDSWYNDGMPEILNCYKFLFR